MRIRQCCIAIAPQMTKAKCLLGVTTFRKENSRNTGWTLACEPTVGRAIFHLRRQQLALRRCLFSASWCNAYRSIRHSHVSSGGETLLSEVSSWSGSWLSHNKAKVTLKSVKSKPRQKLQSFSHFHWKLSSTALFNSAQPSVPSAEVLRWNESAAQLQSAALRPGCPKADPQPSHITYLWVRN